MLNKLHASKFDNLNTPVGAIDPLLRHLPYWVKNVWCPCDEDTSEVVRALNGSGRLAMPTHIDRGVDFLKAVPDPTLYDMIITNPPYSNKDDFIEHCIDLGRPWALLLPLDSLCGKHRFELYQKANNIGVITLHDRLDFTGKGANWFYNAWVCSWPEINGKWIQE